MYKVITSLNGVPGDALCFMDETTVESHQGIPRLVDGREYHKFISWHMSASDRLAFRVTLCLKKNS